MQVPCTLCDKEINTKKDNIYMTVRWRFKEMLDINKISLAHELPRVVGICSKCWSSKLKKKLDIDDYYWQYSKEV